EARGHGRKDVARKTRALKRTLLTCFSFLPQKGELSMAALLAFQGVLDQKYEQFPITAAATWRRVSDEDAWMFVGAKTVHFLVSGDGDSAFANLQCFENVKAVIWLRVTRKGVLINDAVKTK